MLIDAKTVVRLAVGLVVVALALALWRQTSSLRSEREASAAFRASVAATGRAQEAATAATNLNNQKRKERADEEHARRVAALRGDVERMRGERDAARGSFVPGAPAGSEGAAGACFDREELERAIGGLVGRVRAIAAEGDSAITDLNTAKEWARGN